MRTNEGPMMALQLPGRAVRAVMIVVFTIWLTFAIGLNWGGAPDSLFVVLTGNTERILQGEVWRLFTAPLLHDSQGVGHIITSLLGLFFFAPRLEEVWGPGRMLRFIALSAVLAYVLQMLVALALPESLAVRLVGSYWFGLTPMLGAISIAWALTFKNEVVQLFFVIPVTSRMLIVAVIGLGVLSLVADSRPPGGLLAPFGGMLCGWLLGGGNPSPLRKAWLKLRLSQLNRASERASGRRPRPNPAGLRVLPGGRAEEEDDKGPDGRWLN